MSRHLDIARDVIALEIAGLQALNDSLDPGFSAASQASRASTARACMSVWAGRGDPIGTVRISAA